MLRKRGEPITEITEEIKQLAADMIATLDHHNGVGLAAQQVGKAVRLFVLRNYIEDENGHFHLGPPRVYINPKLSSPEGELWVNAEGCLSIPGIRGNVYRPYRITVEATDINGQLFTETAEGENARVRMHENDHINGVLYIDRMDPHDRKKLEPFLQKIKKEKSKKN